MRTTRTCGVGDDRDHDDGDHAVVYFGEPIRSGYLINGHHLGHHLVNVTSLKHERWKREHPEFCRKMRITYPHRPWVVGTEKITPRGSSRCRTRGEQWP